MFVYIKSSMRNDYALYLEIDNISEISKLNGEEKWKHSASILNTDLNDGYIAYAVADIVNGKVYVGYHNITACPPIVAPLTTTCNVCTIRYDETLDLCPQCHSAQSNDITSTKEPEHTGLSVGYYDVVIPANSHTNPEHNQPQPIIIGCNDIIEALKMNYACANVFKAVWRICAAKLGKTKKGNNTIYDGEKIVFFGNRVLKQEQVNNEKT